MLIETTMYMHRSILVKIDSVTNITGRTRTSVIKYVVQRVMHDNQRMIKTGSRVRYQESDIKENWHRIHVVLNEYEYEYYMDLRKFLKMSVSFIIAYAVLRYLDELIDGNIRIDNYQFKNYVFIKKTCNGTICWKIYWGIPPNLSYC